VPVLQPFSLDVTADATGATLQLELSYHGDRPVELYRADLPWGSVHSLILAAVRLDPFGSPLEQVFPIDDPGPETVVIDPGDALAGSVDLAARFPALAADRQAHDVMVFWTYQPRDVEGLGFERLSGSLLLPPSE
jgi:hypothetical protein